MDIVLDMAELGAIDWDAGAVQYDAVDFFCGSGFHMVLVLLKRMAPDDFHGDWFALEGSGAMW